MRTYRPPPPAALRRDAQFGHHVLPSDADDRELRTHVQVVFAPSPPWRPFDPQLIQQLMDFAPQPDQIGVNDMGRALRADEHAQVWGTPMEGPDIRRRWLERADEVCRAWGAPLFGPRSLIGRTLDDVAPAELVR
jgi:hypothetical protein